MKQTPKQILYAHIVEMHQALPRKRMTLAGLITWHQRQHRQYLCNHFHLGVNRGVGERPPGWKTGEDAVHI